MRPYSQTLALAQARPTRPSLRVGGGLGLLTLSKRHAASSLALALALLSGCATPSGQSPATPPPADSLPLAPAQSNASGSVGTLLPRDWWTLFHDPELDRLIDRARQNNRDLLQASARVEAAIARAQLAGSDAAVHLSGAASASRSKSSESTSLSAYAPIYQNRFTASFQLAYEADVWGRIRALKNAAAKSVEVSADDRAAAELALCAQVTSAHLTRLGIRREIALLERQIASYAESEKLQTVRANAGFSTDLEVSRTRVEAASRESERHALRQQEHALANAIALLCGESAGLTDASSPPPAAGSVPELPSEIPLDLLLRRPDVASKRAKWEGALQRVHAARVARYPSLNLSGKFGSEAEQLRDLLDWRSRLWSLASSLSAPLLDGGSLRASLDIEQAALKEATAAYEGAVLSAYREVADSLSNLQILDERKRASTRALDASRRALDLSQERYAKGFATYLDVIESQRSLLAAERTLVQLDTASRTAAVDLIRAMGPL